jgi:hypothetical protein
MDTLVNIVLVIALGAVAVVLFLGIFNMAKGGSGNTSQKLMRARVIAQAIAIALLLGALYFFGGRGGA